jgi:hypothetical protein
LGGHGQLLFSSYSGPQNSAVNVQDIVSVFLLFFGRDTVHKVVVGTNCYAEQFMNLRQDFLLLNPLCYAWFVFVNGDHSKSHSADIFFKKENSANSNLVM